MYNIKVRIQELEKLLGYEPRHGTPSRELREEIVKCYDAHTLSNKIIVLENYLNSQKLIHKLNLKEDCIEITLEVDITEDLIRDILESHKGLKFTLLNKEKRLLVLSLGEPQISEKLTLMLLYLATRNASQNSYLRRHYVEDMIYSGWWHLLKIWNKFDLEKVNIYGDKKSKASPFSFFLKSLNHEFWQFTRKKTLESAENKIISKLSQQRIKKLGLQAEGDYFLEISTEESLDASHTIKYKDYHAEDKQEIYKENVKKYIYIEDDEFIIYSYSVEEVDMEKYDLTGILGNIEREVKKEEKPIISSGKKISLLEHLVNQGLVTEDYAYEYIISGEVSVNGKVIKDTSFQVSKKDIISIRW